MVFGTREVFRYALCLKCGLLFLVDPPDDIGKYYQRDYYSVEAVPASHSSRPTSRLRYLVARYALTHDDLASRLFLNLDRVPLELRAMGGLGLTLDSRILDAGCGSGSLVRLLDCCGFNSVTGCDPFAPAEMTFPNGGRVLKGNLQQVSGVFDLVMFHHSFEHVPDPFEVAARTSALLKPGGVCILRFPNIESLEFRKYGADWWGIHAPRHYFLFSRRSLEIVFSGTGLRIDKVVCDSRSDHYCYSEEYSLDIDDNSPLSLRRGQGIWLKEELEYRRRKAKRLNACLVGDWIVYYLRKARLE